MHNCTLIPYEIKESWGQTIVSIYSDYLGMQLDFENLSAERKRQLDHISFIRKRPNIVYASDMGKSCPNMIDYTDILPFWDQLENIQGDEIDIILETPGGYAEVVEELVGMIRDRFERVGVIVPGTAKSAGTIFTMAADEILMGETSSLGPIDAQIKHNGKIYSAEAFLEGLRKIRDHSESERRLDIAYIPILQNISPGEIQHCENVQAFSRRLVTNWLKSYKFKYWSTHSSTGQPVSEGDKEERATQIATTLCNHSYWLTHGRSIKIQDLKDMRLIITDYRENPILNEAIMRYYTLLRMSFDTNIYKIYETSKTQVYRALADIQEKKPLKLAPDHGVIDFKCPKCSGSLKIHYDFDTPTPPEEGATPFPASNIIKCPSCGVDIKLLKLRLELETQKQKRMI